MESAVPETFRVIAFDPVALDMKPIIEERPMLKPAAGEVLIKVLYFPVTHFDMICAEMKQF